MTTIVIVALSGIVFAGSPATAREPLRYVALGDSSVAGPGIPNEIDATCLRSDHDWPHVLAGRLGAALTDVSCSGATMTHLTGRQFETVPPQFDALRPGTGLVTLAIGANDIKTYEAFVQCAHVSPEPQGATCRERFTVGGADRFAARVQALAGTTASSLAEIHRRSPRAHVVVTGYLTYWRPGGCYPGDPYFPGDADYIRSRMDLLVTMLARVSAANRATYVDLRGPSAGHGLCEAPARRWVEGAVPVSPAYAYHPNAQGMAAVAAIMDNAVRKARGTW
ncbi:SGNH/GDSL hydrolase family protein [Actinoplanes sp. NPDC026623]|uniref:SGNH/GDSL hydrolase family protein n=1 Tax=Actinoplanes sp. NPDC026623 TaxID=3155610 RepID=UPI0033D4D128